MKDQLFEDTEGSATSYDEISDKRWELKQQAYRQAQDTHEKSRMPLYVIVVAAALVLATVNGAYISSGVVLIMCMLFGGGTFVYLWCTRNSGPDLPRVSNNETPVNRRRS
jgi:hypothetical protein